MLQTLPAPPRVGRWCCSNLLYHIFKDFKNTPISITDNCSISILLKVRHGDELPKVQINSQVNDARMTDYKEDDYIIEQQIKVNSAVFDKVAAYNNLVITIGYAGSFAIWNFVKDKMHTWDTLIIAFLLGISIFLFILWTLVNSFINTNKMRNISLVLTDETSSNSDKIYKLDQIRHSERVNYLKFMQAWFCVFLISAITGMTAGLMLLLLIFLNIFSIDFSYYNIVQYFMN